MRHQKKRWFAALLALCMLLSILPSTSLAFSESEETWSGNRRNQTIDGGTHTITLSNLTIDSPGVEKSAIDITGNADVTFILEGNNTLRGYRNHPAIWVESGSSVTFEGNGLLEASAGGASIGLGAAGIGGGYHHQRWYHHCPRLRRRRGHRRRLRGRQRDCNRQCYHQRRIRHGHRWVKR